MVLGKDLYNFQEYVGEKGSRILDYEKCDISTGPHSLPPIPGRDHLLRTPDCTLYVTFYSVLFSDCQRFLFLYGHFHSAQLLPLEPFPTPSPYPFLVPCGPANSHRENYFLLGSCVPTIPGHVCSQYEAVFHPKSKEKVWMVNINPSSFKG